jgi:hypothetical protein
MERRLDDGLQRIADLIDPDHVRAAQRLQDAVWAFEPVERIPVIIHRLTLPDWPLHPYAESVADPEKLLWNQLAEVRIGAELRDDRLMAIRANYGLGGAVIPSLFGAQVHFDDTTTWVEPVTTSDAIRAIIDRGVPDVTGALGGKVLEAEAMFRGRLEDAGLSPYVHLFQADNQGPFDCAFLLWGSDIYFAMHDEPSLVHALLDLMAETSIAFVRRQKAIMGEPDNEMYHWWYHVPGGVRAAEDVTITLSPAMYEEFNRPYNERLFAAFGGGYMHYCGHGLQAQGLRVSTRGLRGIEMGAEEAWHNPAYTLEAVWAEAAAQRVAICWVGPGLPTVRPPGLASGLVYGFWDPDITWEDAPARLAAARQFWRNP